MIHPDPEKGRYDAEYLQYDPLGVRDSFYDSSTGTQSFNEPVTIIPGTRDLGAPDNGVNFVDLAREKVLSLCMN